VAEAWERKRRVGALAAGWECKSEEALGCLKPEEALGQSAVGMAAGKGDAKEVGKGFASWLVEGWAGAKD
jgi:hypothetical protein